MTTPRGAVAPQPSPLDDQSVDADALDATLRALHERATAWAETSPAARAALLARVVTDTFEVAEEWSAAGCAAKGYEPRSREGAEELFGGVGTFVRMAQTLRQSMLDLARGGRPRYPGPVRHVAGNRLAVRVVPSSLFDRLLYGGVTGEVWMTPGVDEATVRDTQASLYKSPREHAGVSLVLGAGNVGSLGPRDVLTKLFVEGKVVLLKANPVNDYLVPFWASALRALIDEGFVAIVAGGVPVGRYLTGHDLVGDIHVTGSDKTHDAIVYGVGEEGARRKAADEPLVTKSLSCELGNVSPVVLVPGEWSERELSYQARHVATMMANNAGFNCLTPRVLVTHAGWPQRDAFLAALSEVLAALPTRRPYYPGAESRRQAFVAAHPDADELGVVREDTAPWTLIRDVDASDVTDVVFNVEAFCALTAETALAADSVADFVRAATDFCNDVVWGTLSMTLLCDPRTMRDPEVGPALDEAIANLRYGSIGVNLWHALSYALSTTTWGAYPGHSRTDIQSGRGVVGNAYLFASPQKSVVRGPFVARPDPAWFATSTNAPEVMRKLLAFEVAPSWRKLPGLMAAALRR